MPTSSILVLDARQDISEQDAHVAGYILEAGRALVVAVNKWERLPAAERDHVKRVLARKLDFLSFARLHFISALEGRGLAPLMKSVDEAYAAAMARLPTPRLTRVLAAAVQQQAPPRAGASRPKLRYAHQGGVEPAAHHRARHRPGPRARDLSPLPGTILPGCFQTAGDAVARGVSQRAESLRGRGRQAAVSLWRIAAEPSRVRIAIGLAGAFGRAMICC